MRCKFCGQKIDTVNKLIIREEFNNVYCLCCGELFAEIIQKDIEENKTNDKSYCGIIKMYIK